MSLSKLLANTSPRGHESWSYYLPFAVLLASYMMVVRVLRYRRKAELEAPFSKGQRPLSSMTTEEAYEILRQLQELEFPYAFAKARRIALLKVRKKPQLR